FRVTERNIYAYLFGVKNPISHVMGYFISILREKIANFEVPRNLIAQNEDHDGIEIDAAHAVSINDLRKNLREINDQMVEESRTSAARYGVILDASLITGIDPPQEVESALAAINTAHNNVSSEISRARAAADQTIVQSRRAVEIETLKAKAEVEPLAALAKELSGLQGTGAHVLNAYVRNIRLGLFNKAKKVFLTSNN
ncbi:MAG: SPFH domain-containing protein, partial [Proteobacteria bacterium]|nr:SPFH domain-containing protein [Pseudomonadota bacterium]